MGDDDEKVTPLPVRFKKRPDGSTILQIVDPFVTGGCGHIYFERDGEWRQVTYIVRPGETEVECGSCGTKLDPMWVLKQLAGRESNWNRSRQHYREEMARLRARQKTKCEHCGQMTRISHR